MIEILIDNKNGNVWDVSNLSQGLTWTTTRVGKASSVEFKLTTTAIYQNESFTVNNGDVVRVRKDNFNVFYGYVFSISKNDEEISIKAYDQIRYLLNKGTYKFVNVTTGEVIKKIAAEFNLKVGRIDATDYRIASMVEDGQTLLDIIEKANTYTMYNKPNFYVFFDDFGMLSLREVSHFMVDFYVGDGSLLTSYDYSRDIDSDTYNRIKLYQDNAETGKRELYMAQDRINIAKWGTLQLYQSVDDSKNPAQIEELLDQLARLKNRETQTLKLEAIGDIRLRAGMYVPVIIQALDIKQHMMIDEIKHSIAGEVHTMSMTLKVI